MEKHSFPPLHSLITEGVVVDHLVGQIYSSHVAIVLRCDLEMTLHPPSANLDLRLMGTIVIMDGRNHGDSSLVHPVERKQPFIVTLCTSPFDMSVDEVKLCKGALLVKFNLKTVFRNLPAHPDDRWLFGMLWENQIPRAGVHA